MNGDIAPEAVDELPPKLLPTVARLRSIAFNQLEIASVFGIARASPAMRTLVAAAAGHDYAPGRTRRPTYSSQGSWPACAVSRRASMARCSRNPGGGSRTRETRRSRRRA